MAATPKPGAWLGRRFAVKLGAGLLGLSALALLALGGAGLALSRPAQRDVGLPPKWLPGARSIDIPVPIPTPAAGEQPRKGSATAVAGWFIPGRPGGGAVLLLHGIRGSRLEMAERARCLSGQGYAVLLIDLPAHGESRGSHITYGIAESAGVDAALAFLARTLPGEKLGVIGVSLGAASLVFAAREASRAPDAVVLESMYPTIDEAVRDRLRLHLGVWGETLAPLLLWQLPLHLGLSAAQLRPIDALPGIRVPILIVSGSQDQHTTLLETERLYAVANQPKDLWVVMGAAHVNLYTYDPPAYEARVFGFLARHLRGQPA